MVAEGAIFIVSGEWWVALFPGATLMVAVFCFNLLGDGVRDIVDPGGDAHERPCSMSTDFSVEFRTRVGIVRALDRVGFASAVARRWRWSASSGSGKSVTAYALLGLLDAAGRSPAAVPWLGDDSPTASPAALKRSAAAGPAMIFQNPRAALNPIRPIGKQIADVVHAPCRPVAPRRHRPCHRDAPRGRHPRSCPPRQRLSVRAVGGHVPAGDDRHRGGHPPCPADRRRADDRASTSPPRRW